MRLAGDSKNPLIVTDGGGFQIDKACQFVEASTYQVGFLCARLFEKRCMKWEK